MKQQYLLLKNICDSLIQDVHSEFQRDIYADIHWEERIVGLIGERGVGKTTLMLQRLKKNPSGFYFSADNPIIKDIGLFHFIYFLHHELHLKDFYIDEIHKYHNWASELKSLYDSFPQVRIVFSGSSSLDLYAGILDLSRRVSFYRIHPMNYTEYLKLYHNREIPNFTLSEILTKHREIALTYGHLHNMTLYEDFIKKGQYPYLHGIHENSYVAKFQNLMDKIIIEDLPVFVNLQTASLDKIRKLMYFIANSTPSELSFTHLSRKIGVDKLIVENVLVLLSKIGIISMIPKFGNLSERVRKEYKIFLGNTNLYNAYNLTTDIGILRECFFISQVKRIDRLEIFTPKHGDFTLQIYDRVLHFEIGGKQKQSSKYPSNLYILKDILTISDDERIIPLWLFGLLK